LCIGLASSLEKWLITLAVDRLKINVINLAHGVSLRLRLG